MGKFRKQQKGNCLVSGENRKQPETTAGGVWWPGLQSKGYNEMKFYQAVSLEASLFKPLLFQLSIFEWMGIQFNSVQSLSCVWLFATPWIAACQASLSITNSWSLPKLTSIESVMSSNHLILCRPLLLLPPVPPSIRAFSNESTLHMRWPKYWSFSFSISPSNEHPGLISFRMD